MRLLNAILCFSLALNLSACGARKLEPVASAVRPKVLVLMPVTAPADMARERAGYIEKEFLSELKSAGFYVLAPELAGKLCGGAGCPLRAELAKSFGAEAFVQLQLDSISRNNFVAGYYNAIKGKVSVTDRDNKELFSFPHSESEKGGLLFNTGQIFQGIKSQIENSNAKSFEALAGNFVKSLTARFPEAPKEELPESNLSITNVVVKQPSKGLYSVCAEATPGALAFLVLAHDKPNLREVRPGQYCTNLEIDASQLVASRPPQIELRSLLGSVVRNDLPHFRSAPLCDLDGLVRLSIEESAGGKSANRLLVECGSQDSKCLTRLQDCMGSSYIVYRSPNMLGPYLKVGKFSAKAWKDPSPAQKENAYALVAVNGEGLRSKPVNAKKIRAGRS